MINPEAEPKQIDLALTTNNLVAANVVEISNWLDDSQPTTLRGIYELKGDTLQYCFAQPGEVRPEQFEVAKGSRHTLVKLKRFSTGEQLIEQALRIGHASFYKDPDGWIQSLTIGGGGSTPSESTAATAQSLLARAVGLKKLSTVNIIEQELAAGDFRQLNRLKSMRHLTLRNDKNTVQEFSTFKPTTPLSSLSLQGKFFTDHVVPTSSLVGLTQLSLHDTRMSGAGITALVEANPQLTRINISGTFVDNTALTAIAQLPRLVTLSITKCALDDDAASIIARSPKLGGLLLQGTNLTDAGLAELTQLKNLTFLRICQTSVSDEGLQMVATSFPKLRTLYANRLKGPASANGIRALGNHPALNEIHAMGAARRELITEVVSKMRKRHRDQEKARAAEQTGDSK